MRGSRPTLWLMLDSKCPPRDNGIPPCLHMRGRLGLLWTWTLAPSSGGQKRRARRGPSSRTCPSPCCSCSPEDSSARGRHSTPPRGQKKNRPRFHFCIQQLIKEQKNQSFCVYVNGCRAIFPNASNNRRSVGGVRTLSSGQQPHSPLFSLQQVVPAGQLLLLSHGMSVTAPG